MFYQFLKYLARFALLFYYRRIYIKGLDKIPKKGPIILASNHQNGVIEALLIPAFVHRILCFLTRGDVFNPRYNWFFKGVNMMPVYRFRDGFSNLRNNQSQFQKAYEAITEDKCILIFSEAKFEIVKRLRPIKRGTAKLAFGAMSAFEELGDLKIVPMCVNYTAPMEPRSDIICSIGEPITLAGYFEVFKEEENKAIRALTEDLEKALIKHMIHIESPEREALTEIPLEIARNEWKKGKIKEERLKLEQTVCEHTNQMTEEDWDYEQQEIKEYQELLKGAKTTDRAVSIDLIPSLLRIILGLILLAPALLGAVFVLIPSRVAKMIADKRVKLHHFYPTVYFPVSFGVYLIIMIICFITFLIFLGWKAFIASFICFVCSYISMLYWEGTKLMKSKFNYVLSSRKNKVAIRKTRENIRHKYFNYQ